MDCPKCNSNMIELDEVDFSAQKCEGCSGLWFKDGSCDVTVALDSAEDIDNDDKKSSAAYNEMRDINCPECKMKMIQMIDKSQFHIKYEACHYCGGVFLDSGELSDMAEFTFIEKVKQAYQTLQLNLSD